MKLLWYPACVRKLEGFERRKTNAITAYSVVAFAWRWRRLLRLFEMGSRRRRRDFRFGSDHPVGLLPCRRCACPAVKRLIEFPGAAFQPVYRDIFPVSEEKTP